MENALRKFHGDVIRAQSAARAFFARKSWFDSFTEMFFINLISLSSPRLVYKRRLARAQMSAKERAEAEAREAEELRRQEEARIARERQEAAERAGVGDVF